MRWNLIIGCAAAALAALVGAGWQLASRHAMGTPLDPLDVGVLRYMLPGLVLAPVAWRAWPRVRAAGVLSVAILVAGGGLPFGLLVLAGARLAPAAHIGVFMAGAMPLFTAVAAMAFEEEQVTPARGIGLAAVATGVLSLGWSGSETSSWRGDLLFLLAACAWAAHTLAFRRSGLSAWQGAAVCNVASALALAVILPLRGVERLLAVPAREFVVQLVWQGVLAGLLGLVAYMTAVRRLGSARASLSAAAVPALTGIGAALLLGEPLDAATAACIALVASGVAIASGAIHWRRV